MSSSYEKKEDEAETESNLSEVNENVKLEFTEDALSLIAKKAIERTTGARGLRSILENILLDTMYNLPGIEGVNEIVVNAEVIEKHSKPLYIYDKSDKVINKKA